MQKIKLRNGKNYMLAINGIQESEDQLIIRVVADGTVLDAQEEFEKIENVGTVTLVDDFDVALRTPYKDLKVLSYITLYKDVVNGQINTGTESAPILQDIKSDVFEICLKKEDINTKLSMLEECILELSGAVYA